MTSGVHPQRRGQPLVALALLLAGWAGFRVALFEHGLPRAPRPEAQGISPELFATPVAPDADGMARALPAAAIALPSADRMPAAQRFFEPLPRGPGLLPPAAPVPPAPGLPPWSGPRIVAGHQLLLMAGLGYLSLPDAVRPALGAAPGPVAQDREPPPAASAAGAITAWTAPSRWSGDGWVLLRGGGQSASLASLSPAYGGSQAGAVARYRLGRGTRRSAYVYARATGALDMPGDEPEAALGAGLRPVAALPVRLLAEVRARRSGPGLAVRPAIAAVTELAPVRLPGGFEGEVYAQAGYVGGHDATGFLDIQALAERSVVRPARGADLRIGGGVWAGGQRGAARLDLGPRVSLRVGLGGASSRVALDWRVRVAGNAAPSNGAALTVSAGF
ncbi:MAG: hypothetical protein KGL48_09070 [Sphingomonadales bacterium]|nr:hypothetical protein [Sphingomonadales bacterium]MDE2568133.1 hypothetical protein [Sphingomonadales bacterium]